MISCDDVLACLLALELAACSTRVISFTLPSDAGPGDVVGTVTVGASSTTGSSTIGSTAAGGGAGSSTSGGVPITSSVGGSGTTGTVGASSTTGSSTTGSTAAGGGASSSTSGGVPITSSVGGSGGVPGASGSGGSGGVAEAGPPGSTPLGAACQANDDCGAALTCIRSSDNLSATSPGGVGNGICTADCTVDANVCIPLGGTCVAVDGSAPSPTKAFCFERCTVGPNPPAPPVLKCHGRPDVACEPLDQAETLFGCVPICITDADCGTRKCDPSSGLCVDALSGGKTVGSGCTATRDRSSSECAGGLCLPIEAIPDGGASTPGICSALCRLGTQEACGFRPTPLDAGPPMGACVLPWGDTGYNNGDLGLCLQLCDGPNDCDYRASNWTCRTDITLRGFGHSVCLVPPPG